MLLCIWTTVINIIIYFCPWDNQCCVMSDIVIWCNILIQYLLMCSLFSMLLCFGLVSLHLILNLISFLCVLWSYRRDVLQEIVEMQNYEGVFLPVALRWALMVIYIFLWKGLVDGSFLCSVTKKKDYQLLKVQCLQQKWMFSGDYCKQFESFVPFWTRLARESKALSTPVSLGTEISQIPIDQLRDNISCINKPHVTTIKLLFYYQAL